jgi:hypothetical protein
MEDNLLMINNLKQHYIPLWITYVFCGYLFSTKANDSQVAEIETFSAKCLHKTDSSKVKFDSILNP